MIISIARRGSDWGLAGSAKWRAVVGEAWMLRVRARGQTAVIVATAGWELPLFCALSLAMFRRPTVLAYDYLFPPSRRLDWFLGIIFRLSRARFGCPRSGDAATLRRRFDIPAERIRFHRWPGPLVPRAESVGHDYVYAAGLSHRDWATTAAALAAVDVPAVVSTAWPEDFSDVPDRIRVLPPLSPEEGGTYLNGSSVALQLFKPTDLPCGPLVVLDAMARGLPVVATDCNATRDYVVDGVNGFLVAPADSAAAARAIRRLVEDPGLREQFGESARRMARIQSHTGLFEALLMHACGPQNQAMEVDHQTPDEAP